MHVREMQTLKKNEIPAFKNTHYPRLLLATTYIYFPSFGCWSVCISLGLMGVCLPQALAYLTGLLAKLTPVLYSPPTLASLFCFFLSLIFSSPVFLLINVFLATTGRWVYSSSSLARPPDPCGVSERIN